MANWQVISLDTTTPQLRAPGTGDGYSFNSGSTQLGVWTTAGLGIGTASPVSQFSVQNATAPRMSLQVGAAERAYLAYTEADFTTRLDSDGPLQFAANNATAMHITSTGLVGIGTTSPYAALQSAKVTASTPTGGSAAGIGLIVSNSNNAFGMQFGSAAAGYGWIQQQRNDGTNTQYDLSLQPLGGNVGIGTTSPVTKLNVVDSTTNSYVAGFRGVGGTNLVALGTTSGGASIAGYTAGFAAAADLIINPSAGNLGLGVTPSAWSAFKAFEVASAGNSLWSAGSNDIRIATNFVYNLGNKYVVNGLAAQYIQTVGQHQWYTAASGTAGSALTFTQAMTLDASGNLLVGTTTASYDTGKVGSTHKFLNVQAGASLYAVNTLAGNQSAAGNRLGLLAFVNDTNSATYKYSAWVLSETEGSTANQLGARIVLSTTGDASAAGPIERARVDAKGNVVVNTAAVATTATDGFLYIPTCAGAPTGVPTTFTGRSPLVVDSTNNRFYVYVNGAWKYATLT